jgi:hypothetical protein
VALPCGDRGWMVFYPGTLTIIRAVSYALLLPLLGFAVDVNDALGEEAARFLLVLFALVYLEKGEGIRICQTR